MLCFLDFIGKGTENLPLINQIIYGFGIFVLFFILLLVILSVFFGIIYLIDDYQELKDKVECLETDFTKLNKKLKKLEKEVKKK